MYDTVAVSPFEKKIFLSIVYILREREREREREMQSAISILGKAVHLDQSGQLEAAVEKYAEGVQMLMIPLKNERGT